MNNRDYENGLSDRCDPRADRAEIKRLDNIIAEQNEALFAFLEQLVGLIDNLGVFPPNKTLTGISDVLASLQKCEPPAPNPSDWINRITALLALPASAAGEDIAKAVEVCVRRCEQLELKLSRHGL